MITSTSPLTTSQLPPSLASLLWNVAGARRIIVRRHHAGRYGMPAVHRLFVSALLAHTCSAIWARRACVDASYSWTWVWVWMSGCGLGVRAHAFAVLHWSDAPSRGWRALILPSSPQLY